MLIKLTSGRSVHDSVSQVFNVDAIKLICPAEHSDGCTLFMLDGRQYGCREPFEVVTAALGKNLVTTNWVEAVAETEEVEHNEEQEKDE